VLEEARGGGSVVEIPDEVAAALGGAPRVRVRGTLNGVPFASNTVRMAGRNLLGVHKATREQAGAAFGHRVAIELERDDAPREVEVPESLAKALAGDRAARDAFDALSFTNRKEYADWIAGAMRDETRKRRQAKAMELLGAGVKHP